jgi:hypothetical protein
MEIGFPAPAGYGRQRQGATIAGEVADRLRTKIAIILKLENRNASEE